MRLSNGTRNWCWSPMAGESFAFVPGEQPDQLTSVAEAQPRPSFTPGRATRPPAFLPCSVTCPAPAGAQPWGGLSHQAPEFDAEWSARRRTHWAAFGQEVRGELP